jgi:hypothetical protein
MTHVVKRLVKRVSPLAAAIMITASCASGGTPIAAQSPSPVQGALTQGLIAYVAANGVGVLDPATGKSTIVAPLPAGAAFKVSGPVWAPAPGLSYPVLYFTVHDDRPAESRLTAGVTPYDWLFRVDPFAGVITPVAASYDFQSEGPFGLVANDHFLALTVGCCTTYEVDGLDLTKSPSAIKVAAKPPTQTALFTEGVAPGASGLVAVRAFATGLWYWLNLDANVLQAFPLTTLGPEDGPIAISPDGTMVAVSRPDKGPVIEPIDVNVPAAPVTPVAGSSPSPSPTAKTTPTAVKPRAVNSKLPHADGLAWSPDASLLALAVSGGLQIYRATGADGTAPVKKYLTTSGISGVDWSRPIQGESFATVKPAAGPQAAVNALLLATKLPKAADTSANRPLTKIYVWQYDSSKTSPIAAITDATPSVLAQYPPLAAIVVFHHWAPSGTWALIGGCIRYRVVIKGSIAATASTFGLGTNTPCAAP